jgi:phosphatidylglycerol lysyltransferase
MTARELVMTHGWNATAYQILNPGIEHWFTSDGTAVVGYVRRGDYVLVAGGPVCALESIRRVITEFERFAGRVCYVCAGLRLAEVLATTHSTVTIGAQPIWDPMRWSAMVQATRSLRAQLNRAKNKGVVMERVEARHASADPEFAKILKAWLITRGLPPMHFLVEPDALLGEMADRVVFRACGPRGTVGFLVASPVVTRHGYLIEQVARLPDAPNGASELMIDGAMRHFAEQGRRYVTLGLVALSRNATGEVKENPLWLRTLMFLARTHANRFYNFEGLERFRTKMKPDSWETIYAISNERKFSFSALYAIGEAFAGISPLRALGIGVLQAIRKEFSDSGLQKD